MRPDRSHLFDAPAPDRVFASAEARLDYIRSFTLDLPGSPAPLDGT
jgi:hypothetical protein